MLDGWVGSRSKYSSIAYYPMSVIREDRWWAGCGCVSPSINFSYVMEMNEGENKHSNNKSAPNWNPTLDNMQCLKSISKMGSPLAQTKLQISMNI